MQIALDTNAVTIIERLTNAGFEAYAVGGAVRDAILGRAISDTDIATSAFPETVRNLFSELPVIDTGIKHGTVAVVIDGKPYEVTTFRCDGEYTDSRHPRSVSFISDIGCDLARRDFTVNAMAYSDTHGIIDPFGGMNDIKMRMIRAVGNPVKRFSEDALRILRALRFASVLGFTIEATTAEAMYSLYGRIDDISKERVYSELSLMLNGIHASSVVTEYKSIINRVVPVKGFADLLDKLPPDTKMRFACLCGSATNDALSSLKADNTTKRGATMLASSNALPADYVGMKRFASVHGADDARLIREYRHSLYGEDEQGLLERVLITGECLSLSQLAVNGSDLCALGINGRSVGEILAALLEGVISGSLANEKDVLLKEAKDIDNHRKI